MRAARRYGLGRAEVGERRQVPTSPAEAANLTTRPDRDPSRTSSAEQLTLL
jgi:hypothetical protein